MCCGTAQNSYHTLAGLRVVLADGTVLDTRDAASRAAFREREPELVARARRPGARDARQRTARGAHPPQVPHEEHDRLQPECAGRFRGSDRRARAPHDRLRGHARIHQRNHLRHGPRLRQQGERADPVRRSRNRVPGRHAAQEHARRRGRACRPRGAALGGRQARTARGHRRARSRRARRCWSRRVPPMRRRLPEQIRAIEAALAGMPTFEPVRFSTDPDECARFWNVRKGMFPSVGAMRKIGTTVIIEDVAFPVPRLAEATLDSAAPSRGARLRGRDHLRPRARGQPALRVHAGLQRTPPKSSATAASWMRCAGWSSRDTTARSRRSTAPAATSRRSSSSNGAPRRTRSCARSSSSSIRGACSIPA